MHFQDSLGYIDIDNNTQIHIEYSNNILYLKGNKNEEIKKFLKGQSNLNKTKYKITNPKKVHIFFSQHDISEKDDGEKDAFNQLRFFLPYDDCNYPYISSFSIDSRQNQTDNIIIKNAVVESLKLEGINCEVIVENTKCGGLHIHDSTPKQLKLYNIEKLTFENKTSVFNVEDSDLTNAWFDKVKLNSFTICNFYRTTLENTTFSSTVFPKKIEALIYPFTSKTEKDYHEALYENYRQIKTALLKQNNRMQALEMHTEMYNAIMKSKNLECQDKIILCTNQISNNHGTSISKAFVLSISLIFIIGIIYCLALPNAPYKFGWNGYESFLLAVEESYIFIKYNIKSFFILANPTHKLSSLITVNGGEELSDANYFISFLSRLFIAWAYFQFVSAFRKFGKQL